MNRGSMQAAAGSANLLSSNIAPSSSPGEPSTDAAPGLPAKLKSSIFGRFEMLVRVSTTTILPQQADF